MRGCGRDVDEGAAVNGGPAWWRRAEGEGLCIGGGAWWRLAQGEGLVRRSSWRCSRSCWRQGVWRACCIKDSAKTCISLVLVDTFLVLPAAAF